VSSLKSLKILSTSATTTIYYNVLNLKDMWPQGIELQASLPKPE
jgi:hypothetical protein